MPTTLFRALHDPFTGTHSHSHSAMGDQGGDMSHTHDHSHDGDANHSHEHSAARPKTTRGLLSPTTIERTSSVRNLELRKKTADDGTLSGYHLSGFASVTNAPYEMYDFFGPYTEVVSSGAFTKTLAEKADVRLLNNHDGIPLARTKSGTLTLSEITEGDVTGLWCEADLDPASPLVQQIVSAMSRGDLDQMSFAFRVTRQEWSPDFMQRNILEVELYDVSTVTYPANPATSASIRSSVAQTLRSRVSLGRTQAIRSELRAGKALSSSTMEVLEQVLDLIATADDAVDEAQPLLADLMGVPNPDAPEPEDDERSQGLSPATALALLRLPK